MNNQELELKIKEIIEIPNMFDMIIAAKDFEKDYKTSDFYKITKMSLMEIIKDAKVFYGINAENIKNKLQTMINGLDLNGLNTLFDQISDVFAKENAETMEMLGELKDFKDIIKKD